MNLRDWVTPIAGELLRFRVRSRSNPSKTYLVDLAENKFFGSCGCDDHHYNRFPKARALAQLAVDPSWEGPGIRCWHQRIAIAYHAREVIEAELRVREAKPPKADPARKQDPGRRAAPVPERPDPVHRKKPLVRGVREYFLSQAKTYQRRPPQKGQDRKVAP